MVELLVPYADTNVGTFRHGRDDRFTSGAFGLDKAFDFFAKTFRGKLA